MNIGLNIEFAGAGRVSLCVASVSIICLSSEPAVEVIPVPDEKSPGVGRVLGNSHSLRVLREESRSL